MEKYFYIKFEMDDIAKEPLKVTAFCNFYGKNVSSRIPDEFPKTIEKGSTVTLKYCISGKFLTEEELTDQQKLDLNNKLCGYLMFNGQEIINEKINNNEGLKSALTKAMGFPVDVVVEEIEIQTEKLYTTQYKDTFCILNTNNIKCKTAENGVSV